MYLHGFASGPGSRKARFLRERFAELGMALETPDLAEGDFAHLTLTGQLRVIETVSRGEAVTLIGSSMGGYLAALYAARHPEVDKLVLLAPAFSFLARWPQTLGAQAIDQWKHTGWLKVFHYADGRERELSYQLVEDARQYEAYPDCSQPALVFHGRNDTVVPAEYSAAFVERHPNATLRILESGHELTDVLNDIWIETEPFLFQEAAGNPTRS